MNTVQAYTGTTAINGGTLVIGNGGGFGVGSLAGTTTATTTVTVGTGATLAVLPGLVANTSAVLGVNGATNALGTGASASGATLTLNAGSAYTMSGDNIYSTFNVLKTATLSPASGVSPTLTFDISSGGLTNRDLLAITGAATTGAAKDVINVNYIGGATAPTLGNYSLITAASGLTAANFTLGTTKFTVAGVTYSLSLFNTPSTAEGVTISTFSGADQAYWTGAAGPAWNAGVTNFNTTVAGGVPVSALPGPATDVFFSTTTPAPTNLSNTLGADTAINSLNFLGTAAATTVGGANALTLNAATTGNVGLNVAAGSAAQTITAPIVLAGTQFFNNSSANLLTIGTITNGGFTLTTTGSGPIALTGAVTGTGGLTDSGTGTVTLSATGNSYTGPTIVRSGILAVTGGTITATAGTDVGGVVRRPAVTVGWHSHS